MKPLFTLMILIVLTGVAYSQPGTLDPTFSHDGKQTANVGFRSVGVAIDTRGRIVVAGDDDDGSFKASRFKKNGLLDTSFGDAGTGRVEIFRPNSGYDLYSHALAVQPDNKVLVVGDDADGSFSHGYIARINADGALDTSFGFSDGYSYVGSRPRSVAVQPDGKIVTAGYAAYANNSSDDRDKFQITRLNSNGIGDGTFGIGGEAAFHFGNSTTYTYDQAYSIAIQPDGKVVVAGSSYNDGDHFAVARLLSNGTLDQTFGKKGKVVTRVVRYGAYEAGSAVTIQNDGKILVAGVYSNINHLFRGAVVRYLINGVLDTTYGDHGKVLLRFPNASSSHNVTSIALLPNGKAIVGGYVTTDHSEFALVSLNTDGTLDSAFGSDGILVTKITKSAAAYGVAVQNDGKIVEGGSTNGGVAVARFIGEDAAAPIAKINTTSIRPAVNNSIAGIEVSVASLKVYPNPLVNTATVAFAATGKYTLQLSDMSGKILLLKTGVSGEGITTVPLNLSRYAAGKYVLILTDAQQHRQSFELSKQ